MTDGRRRSGRSLRALVLAAVIAGGVAALLPGCSSGMNLTAPVQTVTPRASATPTPTPTPTPRPTPTGIPSPTATPEPPPPPTPPNAMGGQTDGGNTANTPEVADTGEQPYAEGTAKQRNDYEYRYVVAKDDTVLAIASRFLLQVVDVERVNFRCADPLNVQPGDVLDIRWPLDSEQLGC
ncbi:LysM peptidoglycan-binding domain-containing protein [Subtercola sp. YIM 133946]|uniref:LysM peptidoglycan-binding domain-containing protein n=1 Tax=Subtercola sp. YIM 133946 TaxID=3118909 RepID=UPI002F934043